MPLWMASTCAIAASTIIRPATSQELLVIRRNQTGEVSLDPLRWGLIPYWCQDPKRGRGPINAKCETVHRLPSQTTANALADYVRVLAFKQENVH